MTELFTSLEARIHLADECDQAITTCNWCGNYGHRWKECPHFLKFIRKQHWRSALTALGYGAALGLAVGYWLRVISQ